MRRVATILFAAATLIAPLKTQGQIVHSHNDSARLAPFHDAYASGAEIVEIDLILRSDELWVYDESGNHAEQSTIEELYLNPIKSTIDGGRSVNLTLMIDAKGDNKKDIHFTLFHLLKESYANILGEKQIKILICGDVPSHEELANYPDYVMFDSSITPYYSVQQLSRVALFSEDFELYSNWDGLEGMPAEDAKRIGAVIRKAHAQGKPIRFRGAPDNVNTWVTLSNMGADVINTEQVVLCCNMFNEVLEKRDDVTPLQFPHNKKSAPAATTRNRVISRTKTR